MDIAPPVVPAPNLRELAHALRFLAIDAIETAQSGHPGMPMGMADIATVLWRSHLKHNPANPHWWDRDRFVLSNGHGSMLLYALLHLTGYDLPLHELRRFRQLGSHTPGHPEHGMTPGVETTTGPLGQGLANAVGMALAEKLLADRYNRPDLPVVDHRTYAFVGDGCLMEGISHEAIALAGVWRLNKLIVLYDDNGISIDGDVHGWFRDDTVARFRACGWNVIAGVHGHAPGAIDRAIRVAHGSRDKPTLIVCRTRIGHGSPRLEGSADVHGAPLGPDETLATRRALDWPHAPFDIPERIRGAWDAREAGADAEAEWLARFDAYRTWYPQEAGELARRMAGDLPADWDTLAAELMEEARNRTAAAATRKSSQQALAALVPALPELLGGSADLTGSNLTATGTSRALGSAEDPNYVHYGVREFGMTAIMNGIALHGGFIPYGGTFAVFSDYSRNAIRMSALMRQRVIHVLTHDSIGLGEDGPTHQPVEHAASLRLIPGLDVWRPCDGIETAMAWQQALERHQGPSALLLSRQALPQCPDDGRRAAAIRCGGYVLAEADGTPDAVIIATGSEVQLALTAREQLAAEGIRCRVVSMPCTQAFDRQTREYREGVLPPSLPCVAIEAAHPDLWHKYVGRDGAVIGIDGFGESAPAPVLFQHFGITAAAVVERVRALSNDRRRGQGTSPTSAAGRHPTLSAH